MFQVRTAGKRSEAAGQVINSRQTVDDPQQPFAGDTVLNKIKAYWLVGSRAFLCYFQTRGKGDPWDWLWKRVHDPKCRDFENEFLVWSLLSTAWREGEHVRVLATYRDFEQIITSSWDEKWRARIDSTIDEAEAHLESAPSDR